MSVSRQWATWTGYLLVIGVALLLTGCGKKVTYGAVQFITTPAGVEVMNLKDDANLGMTPVNVIWEGVEGESEYVTVEFNKNGYMNEITSFWVNARHETREEAIANPQPITVELQPRR